MCVNYCDFTRSKIGCPLKIAIFGCTDNTIFLCPLTTGYFAELKIHNLNWLSSKSERFEDCFFNCNSRYKHGKRWQFTEQMCCNGLSGLRSKFSRNHSSKSDKISFFIRKIGKMEKLKIEWKALFVNSISNERRRRETFYFKLVRLLLHVTIILGIVKPKLSI